MWLNNFKCTGLIAMLIHAARCLGYKLIKSVELQISGTKIDKHYGHLDVSVWNALSSSVDGEAKLYNDVGTRCYYDSATGKIYVPLQFFCCRNDGLSFTFNCFQYHDVKINVEFAAACYNITK